MPVIRTIEGPVRFEIPRVKGSRFIADAVPVTDEEAAMAAVDAVRAAFPDASHHCFAWRLDAERTRSSDDGEPGGTAGEPILKRLEGGDLCGVVVVVTRFFGGTKLGMGGLVRAYGEAATEVLAACTVVETVVTQRVRVHLDYGQTAAVQAVLAAHDLEPVHADYGASVALTLAVPLENVRALVRDLGERTAGRARVEVDDPA